MFIGNWRNHIAVLSAVALSMVAVATTVFAWSEYQRGTNEYQEYQQRAYSRQRQTATEIASRCADADAPVNIVLQCLAEQIEAYEHHATAEKNLKAQQDMAFWGFWMVVVAAAGIPISTAGLFAIFSSLRHTREAITNDRRIGEAQARAYLSVIRADIHIDRHDRTFQDHPVIDVFLYFHNSGTTPAINVSYHCESSVATWKDINVFAPFHEVKYQEFINNVPPSETKELKVTCYGVLRDWLSVLKAWKKYTDQTPIGDAPILLISGAVFYEDIFGHTFWSQFSFWLEDQPMPNKKLQGRDDLPTIQARVPTFQLIPDRGDHILPPDKD